MSYSMGESVTGVVSGVTDYGAFVRLPNGETGMVHISKLSRGYVSDIRSVIKRDDVVTATVISLNNGKIGLSMIAEDENDFIASRRGEEKDFESMLSSFKSISEEKLSRLRSVRGNARKKRK